MKGTLPVNQHITYRQEYRRCGKPACTRCKTGEGHGPYWYAHWRDKTTKQVQSMYIGKVLPAECRK